MDPVSLIVGALAAGVSDTVSTAVKDAYTGLRELVRRRLAGRAAAQVALVEHESAPEVWRAPLVAELERAGAGADEVVVAAAQRVMAIVDEAGTRAGKYTVDLRGAQGVQIGDGNHQVNSFPTPPTP